MEPQKLKKWLTVIAVVYLVFPRDLIPDFLGRGWACSTICCSSDC